MKNFKLLVAFVVLSATAATFAEEAKEVTKTKTTVTENKTEVTTTPTVDVKKETTVTETKKEVTNAKGWMDTVKEYTVTPADNLLNKADEAVNGVVPSCVKNFVAPRPFTATVIAAAVAGVVYVAYNQLNQDTKRTASK